MLPVIFNPSQLLWSDNNGTEKLSSFIVRIYNQFTVYKLRCVLGIKMYFRKYKVGRVNKTRVQ